MGVELPLELICRAALVPPRTSRSSKVTPCSALRNTVRVVAEVVRIGLSPSSTVAAYVTFDLGLSCVPDHVPPRLNRTISPAVYVTELTFSTVAHAHTCAEPDPGYAASESPVQFVLSPSVLT